MKVLNVVVVALSAMAGGLSAHAHAYQLDAREKIQVACANDTLQIGAIALAVRKSRLLASPAARRKMLSLARESCDRGAKGVTFVPTDAERSCRTPSKWSSACVDPTAKPSVPL